MLLKRALTRRMEFREPEDAGLGNPSGQCAGPLEGRAETTIRSHALSELNLNWDNQEAAGDLQRKGRWGGRAKHNMCEEKHFFLNKGQEIITRNSMTKCSHWNPV